MRVGCTAYFTFVCSLVLFVVTNKLQAAAAAAAAEAATTATAWQHVPLRRLAAV